MPRRRVGPLHRCAAIAAVAVVTFVVAVPAATAGELTEYRLPLTADDEVAVADLCNIILGELGSKTRLTEAVVPGHIATAGADGALALLLFNKLLGDDAGIVMQRRDRAVVVLVDRERVGQHVDRLERFLRKMMGADPVEMRLDPVPGSHSAGPPVVLIHGLDSQPDAVRGAATALASGGYDVYSFRYPNDGRIEASAAGLGEVLRALHKRTGRRISLVTVSMGGVVARTYLELDPAYGGEVDRFIALCPPFRGSPLAPYRSLLEIGETVADLFDKGWQGFFLFDGLGQAGGDLTPGSVLLEKLAAARRARGVRYSIVAGSAPIVPAESVLATRAAVAQLRSGASPGESALCDALDELLLSVQSVAGGTGDGAVSVAGTRVAGVIDHKVVPLNHLQFLNGDGSDGPIPALDEVRARLPKPAAARLRAP